MNSISSNISNSSMGVKPLDKALINKPQQTYNVEQKADTFESSAPKQDEKKGFFKKWGKALALAGSTVAIVVGGVVAKKKIDAKKVKELEAEARRIAEEQAETRRRELEKKAEEARIEAERKAEERKKQLEEQAKIRAEKEAKQKAEAEQARKLEVAKNVNMRTGWSIDAKFDKQLSLEKILDERLAQEFPDMTFSERRPIFKERSKDFLYNYDYEFEKLNPKDVLLSVVEDLDKNSEKGGNFSVEEIKKCLNHAKHELNHNDYYVRDYDKLYLCVGRYDKNVNKCLLI